MPRACSAWIRFSGMPHSPKPPMRIVAPSGMRATAASALGSTLFMRPIIPRSHAARADLQQRLRHSRRRRRTPRPAGRRVRDRRAVPAAARSGCRAPRRSRRRWSRRCPSRCRPGSTPAASCRPGRGRRARGPPRPTASPTTCISALAVSCGRWLRNASSRSCASALDDARLGAERPRRTPSSFSSASPRAVARRREQPRTALEQVRARVLEPAAAAPAERMAADEREPRRQRAARPRRSSRLVLPVSVTTAGCADVLVELVEQREVLPHRRREDHEVGFGEHDRGRRPRRRSRAAASPSRARPCCRRR